MARIRPQDIVDVRERARIDEVISDVVTLKPAGGGSLKGLCPFHEERSPSFHVTPAKGFYHCFGCQAGGDVIDFVMKTDMVTFAEAVEKLAGRVGIELHYEEVDSGRTAAQGQRTRLVAAHKKAAAFYAQQLGQPAAQPAREFLAGRGFPEDSWDTFGVGFAPPGWDNLTKHLRAAGFTDDEIVTGGLAVRGNRGPYDRFRGRIVWPIRDPAGDVIGFGARRILADDDGPKYLNTPETPLYRKSQALYGVDLARKQIAKTQQAVVVEGYTDVMSCHLAGITTAVATCGTAFGGEHVKVLRRLLLDQDEHRGEVIFTFDGDEAGRKAALRAFEVDQNFVGQTFVAVTESGMDPCDLRLASGDEAVRDVIAARIPLIEFVVKSKMDGHDLDTVAGRTQAITSAAPIVAAIKEPLLRTEYARQLAGWTGMDQATITAAVKRAGSGKSSVVVIEDGGARPASWLPRFDPHDPAAQVERESLKLALQSPELVHDWFASVESAAYTTPAYGVLFAAITAAGGPPASEDQGWIGRVMDACTDDGARNGVRALSVEPMRAVFSDHDTVDRRFAENVVSRLLELDVSRRLSEAKSRLQRTNPIENEAEYRRMFADVLALESYRRQLRDVLVGGQ